MSIKLIVLVVGAYKKNNGEYDRLVNSIKKTWGGIENENFETHYLWCNGFNKDRSIILKNDFVLDKEEGYGELLWKTIGWIEKNIKTQYDYIFRTNAGSYVHPQRILDWLIDKPRKHFYAGVKGEYHGIEFASGSGFFLSRDLCELSVINKNMFGTDHIDDISFGRFMRKNGIELSDKVLRVTHHTDGRLIHIGNKIVPEEMFPFDKNYHWRLRSDDGRRDFDIKNMERLHKIFYYHEKEKQ